MIPGLPTEDLVTFAVLVTVAIIGVVVGGYALRKISEWRDVEPNPLEELQDTVVKHNDVALVIPDGAGIDDLAAAIGLEAILSEWGVSTELFTEEQLTSEDAKVFVNLFDVEVNPIDDSLGGIADNDVAIAVGGGGAVPKFGMRPPVIGVIRHRPTSEENIISITRTGYGSTSTIISELADEYGVMLEQREATALLYGIRAGTREFRRANGEHDYVAAGRLHEYADLSQIEDLRAPGMSGDTFDVLGKSILNRKRDSSFVISNVGDVPNVSTLEEAADTMLRLEGVSTTVVFGIHEDTIVACCRSDDVRTNALDLLEMAFDEHETTGGTSESATARVPLGIFSGMEGEREETLDDLIDSSTRKVLTNTFESM